MTSRVDARLKMVHAVIKLYDKFPSRFTVILKLLAFFTDLKALYALVTEKLTVAVEDTKSTTQMKNKVLGELALAVHELSLPLRGYAADKGDLVLETEMKKATVSKLARTREELVETVCGNVIKKANDLKTEAADYGLTQAMITAAEEKMTLWKKWFNSTKLKRAEITTSLEEVDKLTGEMVKTLKERIDPLVYSIKSDTDLISQYEVARGVTAPGRKETQLQLLVQQRAGNGALVPIYQAHAHIYCTYMDKKGVSYVVEETAQSDIDGEIVFKPLHFGRYDVTITKEGFQPFRQLQVLVKRGQATRLEVEMRVGEMV